MRRIRGGWQLTKKSWGVIRGDPALLRFPLFGALSMIVPVVVAIAPGAYLIDQEDYAAAIPVLVVGIYALSFIGIYFGVALASTADGIFHGRDATFGDGIKAANARLGKIAGWALVTTLFGLLVAAIESLNSTLADIVAGLLGAAWGLLTFMAVPVIAFEGTGPIETLKRSASLFKERWAGQLTGNIAIGGLVGLLGILPAVLLVVAGFFLATSGDSGGNEALGAVLIVIGVILFAISHLVLQALRGVFGVALYRYAGAGETAGPFTAEEMQGAVRTRGS